MRYYGQFDPQVDQVLHERYFPNTFNGVSIECGAFDGVLANCTKFFEDNYNWNTINIEPLPYIYKMLEQNRPNSVNLEIALSNECKEASITVYDIHQHGIYNACASLSHLPDCKRALENMSRDSFKTFQVKCKTYKDVIEELNITKLDLFILDVEGHEFEVLDGMTGCDVFPDVFVIEHGHRTPEDIYNKLKSLNLPYKLDHISFVNSFFVKI
jgi:FkbM family methyltransferase